jgi:hypothetical protein
MSSKVWVKLEFLRDRLTKSHETKGKVISIDPNSAAISSTVDHIMKMYPNSNTILKRRVRMQTLERTGNSPHLLLVTDN